MVLFAYLTPPSWLVANNLDVRYNDLPSTFAAKFASGEWNGLNIQQLAIGPNGHFYAKDLLRGTSQWNLPPAGDTDLNSKFAPCLNPVREVEFLAISPISGFVVRYTTRQVVYSAITSPYFQKMLPTLAADGGISVVKTISFDFEDSILVTFENGGWFLDGTDLDLASEQRLVKRDSEGFILCGKDKYDFQVLSDECNNAFRDFLAGPGGDPAQVQIVGQKIIAAIQQKFERSSQMIHAMGVNEHNSIMRWNLNDRLKYKYK